MKIEVPYWKYHNPSIKEQHNNNDNVFININNNNLPQVNHPNYNPNDIITKEPHTVEVKS